MDSRKLNCTLWSFPMNCPPSEPNCELSEFVEIRFVGLRRSGTHAVQNWLISLFEGPVCYLNDVTEKRKILPDQPSDDLPAIRGVGKAARLNEPKCLLLYAMEDRRLQFLRSFRFENPGGGAEPSRKIDVLLLRDPYNTIASRLKIGRDRPGNGFFRDMFMRRPDGTAFFPQLWKNYAKEFLGEMNCLNADKLCVNFNRWKGEKSYRDEISHRLYAGRKSNEAAAREVPGWGFGSSFDATEFNGKADEMDLDNRWRVFADDPEFRELADDAEMRELSERIFGISGPEW